MDQKFFPFHKGKMKLSSHNLGVFLIVVALIYGFYLINITFNMDPKDETEYLKKEIIKLSKKYITAMAKTNEVNDGTHSNQQTAVLLRSMLDRIEYLENDLHNVIINSTKSFANMQRVITNLNDTLHKELNLSMESGSIVWKCEVPAPSKAYPHCGQKVAWMQENWKRDKKYYSAGVNGTLCSILHFLSHEEDECPKDFMVKVGVKQDEDGADFVVGNDCKPVRDAAFPDCNKKIEWMQQFWRSDPGYAANGVDGSMCSIIQYLSEVEAWCAILPGRIVDKSPCSVPKDPKFPYCQEKVTWLKKFWRSDKCYAGNGVNGTLCSFLHYLSEIETWCPLRPGRIKVNFTKNQMSDSKYKPDPKREDVENLIYLFRKEKDKIKFDWMVKRIRRLWPDWLAGMEKLRGRKDIYDYPKKKILIYIGLLADEKNYKFGKLASSGGPLGELVQWSDVITTLYLLGHDLTVSLRKSGGPHAMDRSLKKSIKGSCPTDEPVEYDIIYTDYIGLSHIIRVFKTITSIKCHLRIVDSFGTEAQFNHKVERKLKNIYGYHNLNLQQYNTMFPHSPDNTFLGFIVENHLKPEEKLQKKQQALVYGKHPSMWQDHKKIEFLDIIQKYFEVHATVGDVESEKRKVSYILPRYVKNHGVLKGSDLQQLLRETKLFVGLGFPYEGPAPLEAIANGCYFLNAKLEPPLGRGNDPFFATKPTFRRLTSQHPYVEKFIGKPHVYTIPLNNHQAIEDMMKEISKTTVQPYLPLEFSYEGMLERVYALTKHQDFCKDKEVWPPLSARVVLMGEKGEACDKVCHKDDLLCEPAFFPSINNIESFNKVKSDSCTTSKYMSSLVAPGIHDDGCLLQQEKLKYSCTADSKTTRRLCPCRDYRVGQSALCESCL